MNTRRHDNYSSTAHREPSDRDDASIAHKGDVISRLNPLRRAIGATALLAVPLVLSAPTAFGKPQPVEVQGIVETLNDTLNEPFFRHAHVDFSPGDPLAEIFFDVPDGKRAIIESVMVLAVVQPGQKVVARIGSITTSDVQAWLSVQPQGVLQGSEYFVGTHAIRLRVDSSDDPDLKEILFHIGRDGTAGSGFCQAQVCGYLVDK
jgi:hypothetical protein